MADMQPLKRVKDEAELLKERFKLPETPASKCTWDQAQAWFNLLTEDQWTNVQSYLYRIRPTIVRQLTDKDNANYIDLIEGRLTRDYIISQHGGGVYNIHVTDPSKPGKGKQIMVITLNIPVSEAEPKLVIAELDLNARENKAYINKMISEGKMTPEGKQINPNMPQPAQSSNGEMVGLVKEFLGMFARMNGDQQKQITEKLSQRDELGGTIGQIFIEQMKQQDPTKLITALVAIMGQQKTGTDLAPVMQVFTTMISQMNAQQAENTKLILELVKQSNDKKNTSTSEDEDGLGKGSFLEKFRGILEIAQELKGGGRAPERTGWDIALDGVEKIGVPLLNVLQTYLQFGIAQKGGGGVGGVPMAPMTATAAPAIPEGTVGSVRNSSLYTNPNPRVVEMPPPTGDGPASGPVSTPAASVDPRPEAQLAGVIGQYGNFILQQMNSGVDGAEFADLIIRVAGMPVHAMIAKHEDEVILTAARMVPPFWQQIETVYGEPAFRKWLYQFRNYEELLAETEDTGETGEELKQ